MIINSLESSQLYYGSWYYNNFDYDGICEYGYNKVSVCWKCGGYYQPPPPKSSRVNYLQDTMKILCNC